MLQTYEATYTDDLYFMLSCTYCLFGSSLLELLHKSELKSVFSEISIAITN